MAVEHLVSLWIHNAKPSFQLTAHNPGLGASLKINHHPPQCPPDYSTLPEFLSPQQPQPTIHMHAYSLQHDVHFTPRPRLGLKPRPSYEGTSSNG